jgi:hypothetical protein
MDVKVGTFNVLNLARPGERFYPDQQPYTMAEFEQKATWIAGQLDRMKADVVGFQEVFHEEALKEVCKRSQHMSGATVVAPGADGMSGPRLGLATLLPVTEAATTVDAFPPGVDVAADGVALPRLIPTGGVNPHRHRRVGPMRA